MAKTCIDIPFMDFWDREEFLHARFAQYEAALKDWEAKGRPSHEIIVKPDATIVCDLCNKEVLPAPEGLHEQVCLVEFGSYVACDFCFRKYYANQKQRYKRVHK